MSSPRPAYSGVPPSPRVPRAWRVVALLSLSGMAGCDMSAVPNGSSPDISMPADIATTADIAMQPDIAGPPDMSMPPDISMRPDIAMSLICTLDTDTFDDGCIVGP